MEIARVFLDIHMGLAFQGLTKIMRNAKYNPDTLPNDKFTLFINSKQTAFKILIGQRYLVYHNNHGKRFPLEAIHEFPHCFDGKRIDFAKAVQTAIQKKYSALGGTIENNQQARTAGRNLSRGTQRSV